MARGSASARGYGSAWQRVRLLVLERDEYVCQLCGRDGANSVDHIQAKARGGSDSPDNLRAAHSSCNSVVGGMTRRPGREGVGPFRDPAQTPDITRREKNPDDA